LQRRSSPRIEARPEVLVGKPVVAGTRIAVAFVLGLFAAGWTEAEIPDNDPHSMPPTCGRA
jgi:uncharacterized protein (DUF433 family)